MQEASGHSEMDEEVTTALETDNQILAPAKHRCRPLALERRYYPVGRLGTCQARVEDLHLFEPPPREDRLEPAADRLDFW